MTTTRIAIGLETTPKKAFASALDWPGWGRSGKTPELAVERLLGYAPRYAIVAERAGLALATGSLDAKVVQELPGDATTAYGVPSQTFDADREPTDAHESRRLAALVRAAWDIFDETAAGAPAELRKGPRGGGRDTAKMIEHVVGAEHMYARQIDVRMPEPAPTDVKGVAAMRDAIQDLLARPSDGQLLRKWTQRYACRRIAWHALDHAWEIEDRWA